MAPVERERIFAALDAWAGTPEDGLPPELFRFLTRMLPMINVDLLVKDDQLGTLLTWRDDELYGAGWHVPGGIIRYRETAETRIQRTAQAELGAAVEFEPAPMVIEQAIDRSRRERGHMISMLYRCRMASPPAEQLRARDAIPESGQWAWHRECPKNLIAAQAEYRKFI
jgi:colanic acid biosynthesis protein WcaH